MVETYRKFERKSAEKWQTKLRADNASFTLGVKMISFFAKLIFCFARQNGITKRMPTIEPRLALMALPFWTVFPEVESWGSLRDMLRLTLLGTKRNPSPNPVYLNHATNRHDFRNPAALSHEEKLPDVTQPRFWNFFIKNSHMQKIRVRIRQKLQLALWPPGGPKIKGAPSQEKPPKCPPSTLESRPEIKISK